jgi:hypothetical protein
MAKGYGHSTGLPMTRRFLVALGDTARPCRREAGRDALNAGSEHGHLRSMSSHLKTA